MLGKSFCQPGKKLKRKTVHSGPVWSAAQVPAKGYSQLKWSDQCLIGRRVSSYVVLTYFCVIIEMCIATHCHRPAFLINMSVH
jgi:hypothetical protein